MYKSVSFGRRVQALAILLCVARTAFRRFHILYSSQQQHFSRVYKMMRVFLDFETSSRSARLLNKETPLGLSLYHETCTRATTFHRIKPESKAGLFSRSRVPTLAAGSNKRKETNNDDVLLRALILFNTTDGSLSLTTVPGLRNTQFPIVGPATLLRSMPPAPTTMAPTAACRFNHHQCTV